MRSLLRRVPSMDSRRHLQVSTVTERLQCRRDSGPQSLPTKDLHHVPKSRRHAIPTKIDDLPNDHVLAIQAQGSLCLSLDRASLCWCRFASGGIAKSCRIATTCSDSSSSACT